MDEKLIRFSDSAFNLIPLEDWYAISSLRERVFVVEQNCPYLDADGKDLRAHHIMGRDENGVILGYARIVHPDDEPVPPSKLEYLSGLQNENLMAELKLVDSYVYMPSIGRVVLDASVRGKGNGDPLMEYALKCCSRINRDNPIFISAQAPLHDFYSFHGFVQSGPGYLEDDIPHIPMIYGM